MHEYAEKLAERAPGDLKVVYILNAGGEACEMSMLLARLYTGNRDILSLRSGYHGMTPAARGITANVTYT